MFSSETALPKADCAVSRRLFSTANMDDVRRRCRVCLRLFEYSFLMAFVVAKLAVGVHQLATGVPQLLAHEDEYKEVEDGAHLLLVDTNKKQRQIVQATMATCTAQPTKQLVEECLRANLDLENGRGDAVDRLRQLKQYEELYLRSVGVDLPSLRWALRLEQVEVAQSAWCAAVKLALLIAVASAFRVGGGGTGGDAGDRRHLGRVFRRCRTAAFLNLINPVLLYLLTWSSARLMWGSDLASHCLLLTKNRTIDADFPQLVSVPCVFPLLLVLQFPVMDSYLDHIYWQKHVEPSLKDGDENPQFGTVFYVLHTYFHFLLITRLVIARDLKRDGWVGCDATDEEQKQNNSAPGDRVRWLPGRRAYPVLSESFLHACLYGRLKRVKDILKLPRFDPATAVITSSGGHNGLHLGILTGNRALVETLLHSASGAGSRWREMAAARVEYHDGEELNCFELAAAEGNLEVARLFFENRKGKESRGRRSRWNSSVCSANRALELSVRGGHFELASELCRWLRVESADLVDYVSRCRGLAAQPEDSGSSEKVDSLLEETKAKLLQRLAAKEESPTAAAAAAGETGAVGKGEEMESHFECPVCLEDMAHVGGRIYACSHDHWLCEACTARVRECPMCRENMEETPPRRCVTAEKIAASWARMQGE